MGMAQWASAFTESALKVSKSVGILAGLIFPTILVVDLLILQYVQHQKSTCTK